MKNMICLIAALHLSFYSGIICNVPPNSEGWAEKSGQYDSQATTWNDKITDTQAKQEDMSDRPSPTSDLKEIEIKSVYEDLPEALPVDDYDQNTLRNIRRSLRSPGLSFAKFTLPNFYTHKKNWRPDMTAMGFHGDTFTGGLGNFYTMKRSGEPTLYPTLAEYMEVKRSPEMTANGFHGNLFSGGLGKFYTMKRIPEMTSSGFHGNLFTGGLGSFYTMKRRDPTARLQFFHKRIPEMTSSGFHSNMFSGGLGSFYTMKRAVDGVSEN